MFTWGTPSVLWVGRFYPGSVLKTQTRVRYTRGEFTVASQATSQNIAIQSWNSLVFGARARSRAIHTLCEHLQTDHAGIASTCICASADHWVGGVKDFLWHGIKHFLALKSSPLAPLFSHLEVRRTHAGEKGPALTLITCPWWHGCLSTWLFPPVTPVGAIHHYVSNHDDFTRHPALWHGHVVSGHGSPVPLDSRKPASRHRDVIPPVCMHHGGGAGHHFYSRCVSLFSCW